MEQPATAMAAGRGPWLKSSATMNQGIGPGPISKRATKPKVATMLMYLIHSTTSCKGTKHDQLQFEANMAQHNAISSVTTFSAALSTLSQFPQLGSCALNRALSSSPSCTCLQDRTAGQGRCIVSQVPCWGQPG